MKNIRIGLAIVAISLAFSQASAQDEQTPKRIDIFSVANKAWLRSVDKTSGHAVKKYDARECYIIGRDFTHELIISNAMAGDVGEKEIRKLKAAIEAELDRCDESDRYQKQTNNKQSFVFSLVYKDKDNGNCQTKIMLNVDCQTTAVFTPTDRYSFIVSQRCKDYKNTQQYKDYESDKATIGDNGGKIRQFINSLDGTRTDVSFHNDSENTSGTFIWNSSKDMSRSGQMLRIANDGTGKADSIETRFIQLVNEYIDQGDACNVSLTPQAANILFASDYSGPAYCMARTDNDDVCLLSLDASDKGIKLPEDWYRYTNYYNGMEVADNTLFKEQDIKTEQVPTLLDVNESSVVTSTYASNLYMIECNDTATLLHCYRFMLSDDEEVYVGGSNEIDGCDETCIVDCATNTHYMARNCTPKGTWAQLFRVKGQQGKTLEFVLEFPPLPESVKKFRIYGVPRWGIRGNQVYDRSKDVGVMKK